MDLNEFVREGTYGRCFSAPSEWRPEYERILREHETAELMLNTAHGFVGSDLAFLANLKFVVRLAILAYQVRDIRPIENLVNLKVLNIDRTGDNGLDFRLFPHLDKLYVDWRNGCETVFECSSLTDLHISHLPAMLGPRVSSLADLKDSD
jgi:hypothetical protein